MEQEKIQSVQPSLTIGKKTIYPAPPKMKVWREFLAFFDQDQGKMSIDEFLDAHINLIVLAFGRPEVTKEAVEESLEISEVVPLTRELFRWLQAQTFARLVNLPNVEAGTGEE